MSTVLFCVVLLIYGYKLGFKFQCVFLPLSFVCLQCKIPRSPKYQLGERDTSYFPLKSSSIYV